MLIGENNELETTKYWGNEFHRTLIQILTILDSNQILVKDYRCNH